MNVVERRPKGADLRQMTEGLFFVYGTLKRNHGNHVYLKHAELLGEFTTPANYTMHSYGGFPAVVPGGTTAIKGEVYKVDDQYSVLNIFRLEGFNGVQGSSGNFYDVEKISTPYGDAWMFIMHEGKNLPVVESGNW